MIPGQPRPEAASQIALPWIVRLRYGMALGQAAAALVAQYVLGIDLPLGWIALGPLLLVSSNLLLTRPATGISTSALVGWVFALDTVCLTGLLMLSGGPSNPFTLLYLVHITLAATILKKQQTWLLGGLSTLCFGLLFWIYRPIPQLEIHYHGEGGNLHLIGMWISFAVAVLLVAMYSARISELLREHEKTLLHMQEELAKKDRLASLVTLAAGAAHELNTPLGTIAIVARELERFATQTSPDPAVAEDSRLIRKEVDRCREILLRMSADGAEPAGQAAELVGVRELLEGAFTQDRVRIELADRLPPLLIPAHAVKQALAALVKNALEASAAGSAIAISVQVAGGFIQFVVTDRGNGMSSETLRRVGEPFFTTKEPGQGMGLGTFLARTLAERLGGQLTFQSSEGAWHVGDSGVAGCCWRPYKRSHGSMSEPAGVALVVDDDEVFRNRLCRAIADRGWEASGAADGPTAIDLAAKCGPDLAIVDLKLPGMGGMDIVRELRRLDETTCIIVLTGYGSIATALTATKLGANHYLSKPADADEILNAYHKISDGQENVSGDASLAVPSLARVEWEHIQRVLADCDGNISQAAKLLGLHRRSLQRKLAKYPPRV